MAEVNNNGILIRDVETKNIMTKSTLPVGGYSVNPMLDPRLQMVLKLNPLYHIITFARTIILYHQIPTSMDFAACIISSIASLIIGAVVFRKNQDKFIYYV